MKITKPTLLLDEKKCRENIQLLVKKAQKNGVDFRPHFKTHQSIEIGNWFKELGVNKICVSSLDMASYFSKDWNDITVAFPTNILEIDTINELSEKIQLNLLVESKETLYYLSENLKNKIGFFIKIDVGYNRSGINPQDKQLINNILELAKQSEKLIFKGFLAHAGHTYKCRTKVDILAIHEKSKKIMLELKQTYRSAHPNLIISLGDTPSCSVAEDFTGIDEIRPGNFVFYDLTQQQIGSNTIDQIAVAMACPIVAIHKARKEIVIYGGSVHFSKDRLENQPEGVIFGRVVHKKENGWGALISNTYIKSLSQEHGIVAVPEEDIENCKIGDYMVVLPVHSCLTANLMKSYRTFENKNIMRF